MQDAFTQLEATRIKRQWFRACSNIIDLSTSSLIRLLKLNGQELKRSGSSCHAGKNYKMSNGR